MSIIVEADQASAHYWSDLWRFRELFQVLAWRDLSVRYKQTVVGIAWAVIRPLLSVIVFTIVFGKLARLESNTTDPYPLIVFSGLLPWMFFATALTDASNSLVTNSNLVSKVYFPRMILPTAAISVALTDMLISLGMLAGIMCWFQYVPTWRIIFLPVMIVLLFFLALGPALWTSAQIVKYRDFRFVIPFAVQLGFYISPVGFQSSIVPEQWRWLYSLNPIVGLIDGFRWCILHDGNSLNWSSLLISVVATVVALLFGVRYFRRTEAEFADYI